MRYLLIILVFLLASCERIEPPTKAIKKQWTISHTTNFVDEENGVICYVYYYKSISCLPLSQTRKGE